MKIIGKILIAVAALSLVSCQIPHKKTYGAQSGTESSTVDVKTSKSVIVPNDGNAPISGEAPAKNPDRTLTFNKVGQKYSVAAGETVNFVYEGIDPESTYIIYESTYEGYDLVLAYKTDPIAISFSKLCQNYIVANPRLTTVEVPDNLKYEQIIWTPREDGSWEVRLGSTERGCKSRALDGLQRLRKGEYEKNVPR